MDVIIFSIGLVLGAVIAFFTAKKLTKNIDEKEFDEFKSENISLKTKLEEAEKQIDKITSDLKQESTRLEQELQNSASLNSERKNLSQKLEEQKSELIKVQEELTLKFENLANKIFEEKTGKFKKDSEESISKVLTPLKEQLGQFQKKIDDSFSSQAKEQFSLKREIERIVNVNEKMTLQTESLTKALKGDVKVQGNWGEVVLERILEDSGLRKNIDYILQGEDMKLKSELGSAQKPDVIVKLPEGKHIIIDSKVSLTAYEKYCSTEDETQKKIHLKEFLDSFRSHIKNLESKKYHQNEKLSSPEFTFMFMPLEGAYLLALQHDKEVQSFAWSKKIAITCPSTLFANLRTIASLWRIEKQNKNAEEIAIQGGKLYDKFIGFINDMKSIGKNISDTEKAYNNALNKLSEGRGNLVKSSEKLKKLGSKTSKSLPTEFSPENEDDNQISQAEETKLKAISN